MAELGFAELGLGHGWSGSPGHALNRWASISFFSPLHSDQPPFMFTGMFLRGPLFLPGSWRESGPCLGGTDTHAAPFRASHAGLLPEPCSALPLASHRLASSPSHCFLPALIATDPAVLWGGWFPGLWPSASPARSYREGRGLWKGEHLPACRGQHHSALALGFLPECGPGLPDFQKNLDFHVTFPTFKC